MEDKKLFEKLEKIVRASLELPNDKEITLDMDLRKDLGMDSLDACEVVYSIEEQFEISLPEEQIYCINTINDLMKYLKTNYKL